MIMSRRSATLLMAACVAFGCTALELRNDSVALRWQKSRQGWRLESVKALGLAATPTSAPHSVLFSAEEPGKDALSPETFGGDPNCPESEYRYVTPSWKEATTAVALNKAGDEYTYFPAKATRKGDDRIVFSYEGKDFDITEDWRLQGSDLCVELTLTANTPGYYSMPTPKLIDVDESALDFALIPGVLHGSYINPDFTRAYIYGWGIPATPVLYRERTASTHSSMLTTNDGLTLAVTSEPGVASEPWTGSERTSNVWRLGLSAMNRNGELAPTLYHPVLGEEGSRMEAGEKRSFAFRYTFGDKGWWPMLNHVANDVYGFGEGLKLRRNRRSLSDRLYAMHRYLTDDSTSMWHVVDCEGTPIGAQQYLGGVYRAKRDALKNADYGAMWMLGALTGDTLVTERRLPFARNFKLKQQNTDGGEMDGASRGQYWLTNSKCFVEEWGPYIEPVATTYYMLSDLGNIALFEPDNAEVRELIRRSADWLLRTQRPDGSWTVAYKEEDGSEAFADLKDYRPTFYGLVVAYRVLGDEKYLEGARRGADWLIAEAVEPHRWLGVCGDTRFAPDFATAQAAQALMELSEISGEEKYADAAEETARFYATSVYTAPVLSEKDVKVKDRELKQWQIATTGLSYEHGGIIGSTNLHGPILLASYAGFFVRMAGRTGDSLLLDMARAAAIGRDAFVDDETGVASYYWAAMNRGAGPYPHHAWWQTGWITDYLLAEAELRSNGKISFPAGFITPKVGPHRTFGFSPGTVDGEEASLIMLPGGVSCDNPDVEYLLAKTVNHLIAILLNDVEEPQTANLSFADYGNHTVELQPYGLQILKLPLK